MNKLFYTYWVQQFKFQHVIFAEWDFVGTTNMNKMSFFPEKYSTSYNGEVDRYRTL